MAKETAEACYRTRTLAAWSAHVYEFQLRMFGVQCSDVQVFNVSCLFDLNATRTHHWLQGVDDALGTSPYYLFVYLTILYQFLKLKPSAEQEDDCEWGQEYHTVRETPVPLSQTAGL
jgi:hypothetical protein